MKTLTFALFALLVIAVSPAPRAQASDHAFQDWVARVQKFCPNLAECRAPGIRVERLLNRSTKEHNLPESLYKQLRVAARQQAYIWSDTILEGDYHASGFTRLDRVEAISDHDGLVGYRLLYSELAWDTSNCNFNAENPNGSLRGCQRGRIYEASFLSINWQELFTDTQELAHFVPFNP